MIFIRIGIEKLCGDALTILSTTVLSKTVLNGSNRAVSLLGISSLELGLNFMGCKVLRPLVNIVTMPVMAKTIPLLSKLCDLKPAFE